MHGRETENVKKGEYPMQPMIAPGEGVEVLDNDGHRALTARRAFEVGATILTVRGDLKNEPTRYSIQVGEDLHMEPTELPADKQYFDDYLWPFLNHGFSPNARMRGRDLVAITSISVGEEITFDYNTNEWAMATPFKCMKTGRFVSGFSHLDELGRNEIRGITSDFILQREAREAEKNERIQRNLAK